MAMPNAKLAYEVKPDSHIMLGRIAERYGPAVRHRDFGCTDGCLPSAFGTLSPKNEHIAWRPILLI